MALLHGNNSNPGLSTTPGHHSSKQRKAAYWGWRSPSKGPGDVKKEGDTMTNQMCRAPCCEHLCKQRASRHRTRQSSNDAIAGNLFWGSLRDDALPSAVRPCGCRRMVGFGLPLFVHLSSATQSHDGRRLRSASTGDLHFCTKRLLHHDEISLRQEFKHGFGRHGFGAIGQCRAMLHVSTVRHWDAMF